MPQALLLIDIQKDYFPGGNMELAGIAAASVAAGELLARFRDGQRPIFHVRHVFAAQDAPFFRAGTSGIDIHDSVAPIGQEAVITKHQVNSFHQTDLKERLDSLSVDELVICGAMSHMCVEAATRAASDLGFRCQVVHDACATRDMEFDGRVIPAQDVHGTAMSALNFAYADVMALAEWRQKSIR